MLWIGWVGMFPERCDMDESRGCAAGVTCMGTITEASCAADGCAIVCLTWGRFWRETRMNDERCVAESYRRVHACDMDERRICGGTGIACWKDY